MTTSDDAEKSKNSRISRKYFFSLFICIIPRSIGIKTEDIEAITKNLKLTKKFNSWSGRKKP